jgi:hypothetical protein
MKRTNSFEIADFSWFPQEWREFGMDILRFYSVRFRPFDRIVPLLRSAMEYTGDRTLIDLGSGGGGPVEPVRAQLERSMGMPVTAVLTDLSPHHTAFARAAAGSGGRISFRAGPVSADNVPRDLAGFRTLFNCFHHFDPDAANNVLADAIRQHRGIGIFEIVERSWVWWAAMLLFPLFVWAITPSLRPFRAGRLLWTYILPVVPLSFMLDGLLSCLRSYSLSELRDLAEHADESYVWSSGQVPSFGGTRVTYLIGWPGSR